MKKAADLIPWKVTDISIRPYDGMWSMNPSIHFDGQTWRCVFRCTDYAMPNGRTIRSTKSAPVGHHSKNAMVLFDEATWKPIKIYKMHERDDHPRAPCANVGFEDMRIFWTESGGLQGIAAALHLARDRRPSDGTSANQRPEQVLLSFDENYDIVGVRPIRGDWWNSAPQKNWVPFDSCAEPRFLYSIGRGMMFDRRGEIDGDRALVQLVQPTQSLLELSGVEGTREISGVEGTREISGVEGTREIASAVVEQQPLEALRQEQAVVGRGVAQRAAFQPGARSALGSNVAMMSGRRFSRGGANTSGGTVRHASARVTNGATRVLGTGRTLLPKYEGLRGGSQLVNVGDDAWLGIGHEMKFVSGLKYYWHTFYLVNSKGKLKAASEPMKLASNGIEFAAGMAIAGDRVAISFGVDDMECKIGETRLSAVMERLRPIER